MPGGAESFGVTRKPFLQRLVMLVCNCMRATFSIDSATDAALRRLAETLGVSKSAVVRQGVLDLAQRADRLSEGERLRLMAVLRTWMATPPQRQRSDALRELSAVSKARREAGRRRS